MNAGAGVSHEGESGGKKEESQTPLIISIHQPNYFPWLGYFRKILTANTFIFLDDVQFSKNSYTNRVQILTGGKPKWMTIPVTYKFGDPINPVQAAAPGWVLNHLDRLHNAYRDAVAFTETWDWIQGVLEGASDAADLASLNQGLVEAVARYLGLECNFATSSDFDTGGRTGDDRLIALVQGVDTKGIYLSGAGGANYQLERNFEATGIVLRYGKFHHPRYEQGQSEFTSGLSILDALFHMGREKTAALLVEGPARE